MKQSLFDFLSFYFLLIYKHPTFIFPITMIAFFINLCFILGFSSYQTHPRSNKYFNKPFIFIYSCIGDNNSAKIDQALSEKNIHNEFDLHFVPGSFLSCL